MFLNELKSEQKELFLDLGICLAKGDGEFDDSEKNVISELCREMGIKERFENVFGFKDALSKIKENITSREKRIILLETAGIVLADGAYSDSEKKLVEDIAAAFEIDASECDEFIGITRELLGIYSKIGNFLAHK